VLGFQDFELQNRYVAVLLEPLEPLWHANLDCVTTMLEQNQPVSTTDNRGTIVGRHEDNCFGAQNAMEPIKLTDPARN
jgi:hypothetical protein